MKPVWLDLADELGVSLGPEQIVKMERFRQWLLDEAIPAGGLGPDEATRLDTRHLADSLLFLAAFPHDTPLVWDLGSGTGLPGIPLAIVLPGSRFDLIDRSGRRTRLLRRASRILDLPNCRVVESDIEHLDGSTPTIVSRASLPPEQLADVVRPHLQPGGVAVVGGSWLEEPAVTGWEVEEIVSRVLDRRVWLLIMRGE